jgi:Cu/Ag efflux protein CusF
MRHVFMIFAAAILVFGVALAASAQSVTGLNESANSNAVQGTGIIAKIDPETRTITVQDFTLSSSASEPTGSPNPPAEETAADSAETTKAFKYSEHTNFASTNPEQMTGAMSDLKVGDAVMLQVDNQNNILRIQEISSQPQNQP